jgi:hypothetical protein
MFIPTLEHWQHHQSAKAEECKTQVHWTKVEIGCTENPNTRPNNSQSTTSILFYLSAKSTTFKSKQIVIRSAKSKRDSV